MKHWLLGAFFLLLSTGSQSQSTVLIDSLLNNLQDNSVSRKDIELSFQIPYDCIVNNLAKSQILFEKLINSKVEKDKIKRGDLNEKLALVYYLKGRYSESFNLHKEAIELYNASNDLTRKANAMARMAYEGKKRNLKSSIEWLREAIGILKAQNQLQDLSSAMNNFGVLAEMNNQIDSALYYYNQALSINIKIKDSIGMPYTLNNIAGVYFIKKDFNEGLKYINKSTLIREKLNDKVGMAWNERSIGEVFISEGKPSQALEHFRKSLTYATKAAYPDLISKNYKDIAFIMHQLKKSDSAYFYFNSFLTINDSLYNSQNQKQLVEMESIYENEKKSSKINDLNIQNQLKETELEKKRVVQVFLVLILVVIFCFAVFILKAYKQKKIANEIISLQKIETENQKQIIEEKQKEIIDSIHYAKRIQESIITNQRFIDTHIQNNFILFTPKDIVSGDFYWATKQNNLVYLAICDSTGHGVPGAFMSLLNIGFLSEAIIEKEITKPNEIFNYTRERLINTISKDGQRDGFDGILVCFDTIHNKITYSAANNEPIIIRNNQIIELPKDKMPVGIGEKQEPFKLYTIDAIKGDTIYLYTDGYADQFGGPKGKKFKYKPLNQLLLSLSNTEMANQKAILQSHFNEWKGNLEQVDDVCVIGIKI